MIRYSQLSERQSTQAEVEEVFKKHPPWALPSHVVDTGERIGRTLYFCENLQAVASVLSLMGNGEDRTPGGVSVLPYEPLKVYVEIEYIQILFDLFIEADRQFPNWIVIFEFRKHDVEYEILSL